MIVTDLRGRYSEWRYCTDSVLYIVCANARNSHHGLEPFFCWRLCFPSYIARVTGGSQWHFTHDPACPSVHLTWPKFSSVTTQRDASGSHQHDATRGVENSVWFVRRWVTDRGIHLQQFVRREQRKDSGSGEGGGEGGLSHFCWWRVKSCGIWCRVGW
jgi:hypothetical protein